VDWVWGLGPIWRDDASESAAGLERAGMEGRDAMADRKCRCHDVSILMVRGAGEGRCFGCCPRRNISMMRIGLPQQGHGCSGEQLIVPMARENPDWGYDRIVGALANLGYKVCDQTVGNVPLFPRDTNTRREGPVQRRERLGGLLRYYHQEAA